MLELNRIYNMDCLEGMRKIEDNSIDLIFTSPPYNLGNKHHTGNKYHTPYNDNLPEKEYQEWQIQVLNECYRILKDDGSMFYNHKNRIRQGRQITPYEWLLKTPLVTDKYSWLLLRNETASYRRLEYKDKINGTFYSKIDKIII